MMKIHAHTRLVQASSQTSLYKFLTSMGFAEVAWFYEEFPRLMEAWFNGTGKFKKSDHLPMHFASTVRAAAYLPGEAVSIALGHLKPIYPVKLTKPIYRSILIDKSQGEPTTAVYDFKSGREWKPLQSWTYLRNPVIGDRDINEHRNIELVLELPASQANRHLVTDYKQLQRISDDAKALLGKLNAWAKSKGEEGFSAIGWIRLDEDIKAFKNEEEVFLYVPAGTSLKCTWRSFDFDNGKQVPRSSSEELKTSKTPQAPKGTQDAPNSEVTYFKMPGRPFKYGSSACFTLGKIKGNKVLGIPVVALRKAVETDTLRGLKALKPQEMLLSRCEPMPTKKFKPEMVSYFNQWLKLHS